MNEYMPERLSPVRIAPVERSLPYGLNWEDLWSFLPGFEDSRAAEARAYESYQKQGLHGGDNSCILTLRYPAAEGGTRSLTVFVKVNSDSTAAEAEKYRFLASRGVAVPRLLGVFAKDSGEVIVQEFLTRIGVEFTSMEEVDRLLKLVADLNSIRGLPGLGEGNPGMPQEIFEEGVRQALDYIAKREDLPDIDPEVWFNAYQLNRKTVISMPRAAVHEQMGFQHVGWAQRETGHQLVLFDFQTLGLSARFMDIANMLFRLAALTGRTQEELFGIYLERLAHNTGERLDLPSAMQEMRLARLHGIIESLPWLVDEAQNPSSAVPTGELEGLVQCLKEESLP